MPFALVKGEAVSEMPQDLYIPPDALEVFLEAFEGPLDLLLYLIRRQNLDILDIPIADITRQYIEYIELMHYLRLELAADYLLMAAMLAEIKSRMLLPRPVSEDETEEDPRAELVRRLREYEQIRKAAQDIDVLPRVGREIMPAEVGIPDGSVVRLQPKVDLAEIVLAFQEVLVRSEQYAHHHILTEPLSVRERMSQILDILNGGGIKPFIRFFKPEEGRRAVVVSLLAILEMTKDGMIELMQEEAFAPIYVRAQC
ncbi:MAG: segregation/condensation protein A [Gammaproteobacteria bacterium]|nr:segregation/condensation protein A [Gammaproteobacteria bacterium]